MKANFRTCPECSTRNRLDKEFCVKCGEPLEGVKAGDPNADAGPDKKTGPGFSVSGDGSEGQSPLVPFALVVITLAVAFAGWRAVQGVPGAALSPANQAPKAEPSIPPSVGAPMDPGVQQYTAGMAALRSGNFSVAIGLLREAVTSADKAEFHLGLAEALEKSGAMTEALDEYRAASDRELTNPRYVSELAKALNRSGRATEAIAAYDAAVAMDPQNLANLRELASLYLKRDDFVRARPHLEAIVRLQPDDMAPKQSLARALEANRDLDGAAKQYRDILTATPQAALSRAALAEVLMKQSRPTDALQVIQEGINLDPQAGILHREKGRIHDRQGRRAEAIAAYREYLRLSPGAADQASYTKRVSDLAALMAQE